MNGFHLEKFSFSRSNRIFDKRNERLCRSVAFELIHRYYVNVNRGKNYERGNLAAII